MKLSVIMPVHQVTDYLIPSITSTLDALPIDSELLLVANGEIIENLEPLTTIVEGNANARLIVSNQSGLVSALNLGIASAGGQYIARMDSDDECLPTRFKKQIEYLEKNPAVAVLGGQYISICEHGMPWWKSSFPKNVSLKFFNPFTAPLAHPTVVMHKDVLTLKGGYRNVYPHAEDFDLWVRILKTHRIVNLPDVLIRYRTHVDQVSSQSKFEQLINTLRILLCEYVTTDFPASTELFADCYTAKQFHHAIKQMTLGKVARFRCILAVEFWNIIAGSPRRGNNYLSLLLHPVICVFAVFGHKSSLRPSVEKLFSNKCSACKKY